MKPKHRQALSAALLAGALALRTAAAAPNTVPWSDSFESYTNGASVVGTNGWSAESAASGVVITDPAVIATLTNFQQSGLSYPLPLATHSNVLQTTTLLTNDVGGTTGGVVVLELMAWPLAQTEDPPSVSTNLHCGLYVNASSNLVIWHQNRSGGVTNNEWRALTNSPAISTNAWSRFTMVQDYGHNMFQVRVNDDTNAVWDSVGWSAPGGAPTGSWFYMVNTNAWLTRVMLGADVTNYVDDVLLTNRCVTWSTNRFVESAANDGSIDAGTTFSIGVRYDTFAGTNGEVFGAGKATVTNVPTGLTGVVAWVDAVHLRLTLSGQAVSNQAANTISNLTVVLGDGAFTLGNAANVDGASNGTIVVAFSNSANIGTLTCSGTHFGEAAANDGSISNTLTLSLTVATFTNVSPLRDGVDYAVSNVPPGLAFVLDRSDATTAVARLTARASSHTFADSITNMNLRFKDSAFPSMAASNVIGSAMALSVDFRDQPIVQYSGTTFSEAAANDGTVTNAITITLSGDTFTSGSYVLGNQFDAPGLPANLSLNFVRNNPTTLTATLTGSANAHAATNSLSSIGFAFKDAAFTTVAASNIVGSATNIALSFLAPPVVSAVGTNFVESTANNGSIANSLGITLSGDTFANVGTFAEGTQYTVANVPGGLTFGLVCDNGGPLTATLSNQATNHLATNSIGNLTVTFKDAAFTTVKAANIAGQPLTFAVTFFDQPVLNYSRGGFTETSGGMIDNRIPLTIGLSGDTFAPDVTGRIAVDNLPGGLAAAFTRVSDTQLWVRLNNAATSHASSDSITNLAFTFQSGAFSNTDANQVGNYGKSNLWITFVDDVGFFNVIPYAESYEDYTNGFWLAGTNGWTADYYGDAGVVDNDTNVTATLMRYARTHAAFPIVTNHVQALDVTDSLRVAVHSESNSLVYVDFMMQPVAMQEVPDSNTNAQYGIYVSTNGQLVIWHCNWTNGTPVNEWRTLQNGPLIDTSRWVRFTVAQDYTHNMFQLRVNEHDPIVDPAGWAEAGGAPTGSWFHMVQTNGTMSYFHLSGIGQAHLDDLTVRTDLPATFGGSLGSVFMFK